MRSVEIVMEMLEAVEHRDAERLAEFYDERVSFSWPPQLPAYGGDHAGLGEFASMAQAFTEIWDPLQPTDELRRLHPRVLVADETTVVVTYRQQGVGRDGVTRGTDVVGIYHVDGEVITAHSMYYREPEVVEQLLAAGALL